MTINEVPDKHLKISRPMSHVPFSRSQVDIIIPFHGQYEKVTRLVESILLVTKSNPYHITLVDDASPNKNFKEEINNQFIKTTPANFKPQVSVIRTETQVGFGGALRIGYDNTELPWVCFMHSDCVVEDQNWLIAMGQSLLKWKEEKQPVKMVSARTNNPGEGVPSLLKAELREKGPDRIMAEKDYLPLYCAMCHRELFFAIGGFIKPYPYALYEDVELAARMNAYGYRQGICGTSWIRHDGGATIEMLCKQDPSIGKTMEENRSRCIRDLKSLA
jgi:GT2 family glycosyltransferase